MSGVGEVLMDYRLVDGKVVGVPKAVVGTNNWVYILAGKPSHVTMYRYGEEREVYISAISPELRSALLEQRHLGDA